MTPPNICIIDYRLPQFGALKIQALLNAIVAIFPAHPEIANTGLVLYGFSEGTDNTNLTLTPSVPIRHPPALADRQPGAGGHSVERT